MTSGVARVIAAFRGAGCGLSAVGLAVLAVGPILGPVPLAVVVTLLLVLGLIAHADGVVSVMESSRKQPGAA